MTKRLWPTALAYLTLPWVVCAAVLFLADLLEDRSKDLVVLADTQIHPTWDVLPHDDRNPAFHTLNAGTSLPVTRIRYGKDFMAVRVCPVAVTSCGWIFVNERVELR